LDISTVSEVSSWCIDTDETTVTFSATKTIAKMFK